MKIAVIGTGNMGTGFAKSLAKTSHEVFIASKDAGKAKEMAASFGKNFRAGSVSEAAAFGEVIILTVGWFDIKDVLNEAGDLSGKVLIDITNPLNKDFSGLAVGSGTSASEEIAKMSPKAKVVKAFNTVFAGVLQSSHDFNGMAPSVFFCGDDEDAKKMVNQLVRDFGYDPVDAGPLSSARLLEQLGFINISFGYKLGMGANQAFRLLRRQ